MAPISFHPGEAQLLVIDLQERLLPAIDGGARVTARAATLIAGARLLGMPLVVSEQYRKGLGLTVPQITDALGDGAPPAIEKLTFGCLAHRPLSDAIAASGRRQLVLCGIETHVCVLQTALQALEAGYLVFIAEDAVGSRRASDRETALRRLAQAGAIPASTEMLIMEGLHQAGTDQFKAALPLVREL